MLVSRLTLAVLIALVVLFVNILFGANSFVAGPWNEAKESVQEDAAWKSDLLESGRWLRLNQGGEKTMEDGGQEEVELVDRCPPGMDRVFYKAYDVELERDVCAETCVSYEAFKSFFIMFETRMQLSSHSPASECAASGYTLIYKPMPSSYISVVPMFDVYSK